MEEQEFDEFLTEIAELLHGAWLLKQKAKEYQKEKNSLPMWLVKLLKNNPKA